LAATVQDMLGKWRWQDFTIEVSACQGDSACAKIVGGPKNVGMDLFASKLISKDGELFARSHILKPRKSTTLGFS